MPNREKFVMIDLFAAPGGLSHGFEMPGFRALVGMDIDENGMMTYQENFSHAKVLSGKDGDGRTPAEVAGVNLNINDGWGDLIELATKYRAVNNSNGV